MKKNIMITGIAIICIVGISVGFVIVPLMLTPPPEENEPTIPWPTDNWTTSTPEEQNMDSTVLLEMYDFIEEETINLHSILVIRNGFIVEEKYLENSIVREEMNYSASTSLLYGDTQKHAIFSMTKSVISILIGIAIDKGFIESINQTFFEFFPERWNVTYDDRKHNITIENLLRMESGLYGEFYGVRGVDYVTWGEDYLQRSISMPLLYDPGYPYTNTWGQYSNAGVNLLSAIINKTTGMKTADFAQEYLFGPLGISEENYHWREYDGWFNTGSSGLYMYPHDMAKLGYLCLNYGNWNGTQIVSSEWIESAQYDYPGPVPYGYLIWISNNLLPTYYYFGGANGQQIIVVPNLDIVVVITADEGSTLLYSSIIRDYIFESSAL